MDDSQKWLEAAAGIEQDLEYLKSALTPEGLKQLRLALALYRQNAAAHVPWPSPDELYCIRPLPAGTQQRVAVETRPRLAV
ncbi:MAG TPA: hypothetical protein VJN64_16010 [Terriglobales bacterium]|nr:hypothetical protein [Terriglobales bacterium]